MSCFTIWSMSCRRPQWCFLGRTQVCGSAGLDSGLWSRWYSLWVPQVFWGHHCFFCRLSTSIRFLSGGYFWSQGSMVGDWIDKAQSDSFVVVSRDFAEFLGRLGFVSQVLVWLKPHLSPLYAWSAATASGTVGKLPQVILTMLYLRRQLSLNRRV